MTFLPNYGPSNTHSFLKKVTFADKAKNYVSVPSFKTCFAPQNWNGGPSWSVLFCFVIVTIVHA